MRIVLASESAISQASLWTLIGLPYETRPSRIDEKSIRHEDPVELTLKARRGESAQSRRRVPGRDHCIKKNAFAAKGSKIYREYRQTAGSRLILKNS